MVSGYPTSMNIRQVDGLSTDPRETCKKILSKDLVYTSLFIFFEDKLKYLFYMFIRRDMRKC